MRNCFIRHAAAALALVCLAPLSAQAQGYSGFYIFGDSLSDSGNNALATAPQTGLANGLPQAIANNSYIPELPYAPQAGWNNALGLATYSNGNVWATQAAAALGLAALPSLAGGSNFAFGGAETFQNGSRPGGFPFSLNTQVSMLLAAKGGALPSAALYVVEGGGNNARHALESLGAEPTLGQIVSTISQASAQYAVDVGTIVDRLQAAGAQHIVVWNAPNVAAAPAISAQGAGAVGLASLLVQNMNTALDYRLASETGVSTFDVFGLVGQISANPSAYGLTDTTNACITGVCNPATNLFWDGIHPTAAAHQLLADAFVAQVVPEPGAVWLMVAGLAGIGLVLRRRA